MARVLCAFLCDDELVRPCNRVTSWPEEPSVRRGGEPLFAWFNRFSVSRSRASRASSSCVCEVTACFLYEVSACSGGRVRVVLLVDGLVERVEVAVQLEQAVELGHEVDGYRPMLASERNYTGAGRSYDCGRLLGFQP
jgi:hypothetical protein